jgi:hypothetical protein
LVQFSPVLGTLCQEKSGNPVQPPYRFFYRNRAEEDFFWPRVASLLSTPIRRNLQACKPLTDFGKYSLDAVQRTLICLFRKYLKTFCFDVKWNGITTLDIKCGTDTLYLCKYIYTLNAFMLAKMTIFSTYLLCDIVFFNFSPTIIRVLQLILIDRALITANNWSLWNVKGIRQRFLLLNKLKSSDRDWIYKISKKHFLAVYIVIKFDWEFTESNIQMST